jgi:phytoene synthase
LWDLDLAFADVVATSTDPNLGAIRLAWWRERLDDLDAGKRPPAEPRLEAIAVELLARGVTGGELSKLEDGWLPLLAPSPWNRLQADGLRLRGRTLFGIGARLLGGNPSDTDSAGAMWSLRDVGRTCTNRTSNEFLNAEAREAIKQLPAKAPAIVRPMTVLAALAAAELVGRSRIAAALAHRFRGTFPRS